MKTITLIIYLLTFSIILANPNIQHGKASWYSVSCNHGTKTSSGVKLNDKLPTAASKKFPMGTQVKVTNLKNGKSEIVTITDYGPHIRGRVIDVTISVAEALGFKHQGITSVKVEVVGKVKLNK
jgi:rare lipoprotein A